MCSLNWLPFTLPDKHAASSKSRQIKDGVSKNSRQQSFGLDCWPIRVTKLNNRKKFSKKNIVNVIYWVLIKKLLIFFLEFSLGRIKFFLKVEFFYEIEILEYLVRQICEKR